jgi:DNA-binding CsgD family transcriptional regulator
MLAMSMVGRAAERAELLLAWERTAAGSGPVTAVITGDPGVGKSMLVASVVNGLQPRPHAVLAGTARVHAPSPYDWLAAVLTGVDPGALPVPAEALAWLGQNPAGQGERFAPAALLRMAVRTVRALVGDGPAVLLVEDLHAYDPASLNLVGELAATTDLPVLVVVTSQLPDAAVSPKLAARTLARLAGASGGVRQHLGPLEVPDVAALLAQVYPGPVADDVVEAVWEQTGGNPYCLRELLVTAGGRGPEALVGQPLPAYVRGPRLRPRAPAEGATEPAEGSVTEPRHRELTAREREVLACLAAGMSDKQVARSLGISIRTVNAHVSNVLRKTRLRSRTEAALWAVRHLAAGPTATT